jgi:putative DNA methylase
MTYKKKLIEVALPLEAINAACKEDKGRKTGTIRNLHKWFAPMPVPALRAMIFAALVNDPEDDARRADLLRLIEQLVSSGVEQPAESVLVAAKAAIRDSVGELPIVLDPFCGGGSTLVEAQRLGLQAAGSDLNPLPVLISKMLTSYPPMAVAHGPLHPDRLGGVAKGVEGFVSDLKFYGNEVYNQAKERLGQYYPVGPTGDPVIAWWWARTVESPDPRFQGVHTPLVSNWWMSKAKSGKAWLEATANLDTGSVDYAVRTTGSPPAASKSECLFSRSPIPFDYVRSQGKADRLGVTMLAMITQGQHGRGHHVATDAHRQAAAAAIPLAPPTASLPEAANGFRVQGYGMSRWSDLFTDRQMLALEVFAELVAAIRDRVLADGGSAEYADAVTTFLGLCVGKLAQANSVVVRWNVRNGPAAKAEPAFARHNLSMIWDFAETNPFGGSVGDWHQIVETAARGLGYVDSSSLPSQVSQGDARSAAKNFTGNALIVTDPPYFSAIDYADLSDYFYIWIRRALRDVHPDLLATMKTPKDGELIAAAARHDGSEDEAKAYFVEGFTEVFRGLLKAGRPDLPVLVVYAFKEQESDAGGQASSGWEAMLDAILRAGLSVVGTWPIWGTSSERVVGLGSNALATYVLLVCRPREVEAGRTTRRELSEEMRDALAEALPKLQAAAILPVDLAQAVLGPGMAVFSKYARVLEPDGTEMTVRDALLLINRVLAEVIQEQEGDLDPETRWATTWFEQHRHGEQSFGEADSLARSKVTTVDGLVRTGIVKAGGGLVQLLPRESLPDDYDPRQDQRPTVWEGVQHLIKRLARGEAAAAELLGQLGAGAEPVRELAYRLYQVCEKRGWSEEAQAYNQLIGSWPELARLAADSPEAVGNQQQSLL